MNGFTNMALSVVFLVGFDASGLARSSTITTYAGLGRVLPVGGAQAITQPIDAPSSTIPDVAGGFYIASLNLHRIYRVAADGAGNLFIADRVDHCIRKVTSDGVISTVAGSGAYGFSDSQPD